MGREDILHRCLYDLNANLQAIVEEMQESTKQANRMVAVLYDVSDKVEALSDKLDDISDLTSAIDNLARNVRLYSK